MKIVDLQLIIQGFTKEQERKFLRGKPLETDYVRLFQLMRDTEEGEIDLDQARFHLGKKTKAQVGAIAKYLTEAVLDHLDGESKEKLLARNLRLAKILIAETQDPAALNLIRSSLKLVDQTEMFSYGVWMIEALYGLPLDLDTVLIRYRKALRIIDDWKEMCRTLTGTINGVLDKSKPNTSDSSLVEFSELERKHHMRDFNKLRSQLAIFYRLKAERLKETLLRDYAKAISLSQKIIALTASYPSIFEPSFHLEELLVLTEFYSRTAQIELAERTLSEIESVEVGSKRMEAYKRQKYILGSVPLAANYGLVDMGEKALGELDQLDEYARFLTRTSTQILRFFGVKISFILKDRKRFMKMAQQMLFKWRHTDTYDLSYYVRFYRMAFNVQSDDWDIDQLENDLKAVRRSLKKSSHPIFVSMFKVFRDVLREPDEKEAIYRRWLEEDHDKDRIVEGLDVLELFPFDLWIKAQLGEGTVLSHLQARKKWYGQDPARLEKN